MSDINGRLPPRPLWRGKKAVYVGGCMTNWDMTKYWADDMKWRVKRHSWDMVDRGEAIGMGLHARLGAASPIQALDDELIKMILDVATLSIVFNG